MCSPLLQRVSMAILAILAVLAVLLLGGPTSAEDKPAPAPKPLTDTQAADQALAAVQAGDTKALQALAAKEHPDPWLVVDELGHRGEHDTAAKFAKAAPRVDTEMLPAYARAWRVRASDAKARALLAAMNDAIVARQVSKVLEGTETLTGAADTVVAIRLRHLRCRALAEAGRRPESTKLLRACAEAAQDLGWLRRASVLYSDAARFAYESGDRTQALEFLEVGFSLHERRGDEAFAAAALRRVGLVRQLVGDLRGALEAYGRVIPRLEALGSTSDVANVLISTGIVHRTMGAYAESVAALERGRDLYRSLGDKAGVTWAMITLGVTYHARGDYADARTQLEQALALAEQIGHKPHAADALSNLGNVYERLAAFDQAIDALERALAQMETLGNQAGVAASLINIGSVHDKMGDYAQALSFFERGLALAETIGHWQWALNARVNIANAHQRLGDPAKALPLYEAALAEERERGLKAGAASSLFSMGNVYQALGNFARALSLYEQARAVQEALGDKAGLAGTLSNIGIVYEARGDYAKALTMFERALAQFEALGDKVGAAGAHINIGLVHRNLGDHESALASHRRGLAMAEAIGHRPWAANALTNIGVVLNDRGDLEGALAIYEKTLVRKEQMGDRAGVATLRRNIGCVQTSLGKHEQALATLERALAEHEALDDKLGAAWTRCNMGFAYEALGELAKARAAYDRSARAARSLRANPLRVLANAGLAHVYLAMDQPGRALSAAEKAMDATESLLGGLGQEQGASARQRYASLYEIGALAAAREDDSAAAMMFLESGRAGALLDLLERREHLRWKASSLPPALRKADLEAQAAESKARHACELAAKRRRLDAARDARKSLDEAIRRVREVTGRIQRELKQQAELFYPRPKAVEDVEPVLEADEALVLYGLCLGEALAVVVRRDGSRIVSLGSVDPILAACEALDASDPAVNAKPAIEALRKHLVTPLELAPDVRRVLISPEGALCYVPFVALFDQTIAMTPSGTTHVLLRGEERARGEGVLALGDPDYGGASPAAKAIYHRGRSLSPLPASRVEVRAIGTKALLGATATEQAFHTALPARKRWRAVHFACHGLVDVDRPMFSSLALSRAGEDDGFLTAREILRMEIPADLAVLSACETGRGKVVKGEGIVGLTRAFMFAGAPRVICSLWKVDDEATQALMIKFYELWNPKEGKGLGAAEALKTAQEHIKAQEKWQHPYYWAAWVLWGLSE